MQYLGEGLNVNICNRWGKSGEGAGDSLWQGNTFWLSKNFSPLVISKFPHDCFVAGLLDRAQTHFFSRKKKKYWGVREGKATIENKIGRGGNWRTRKEFKVEIGEGSSSSLAASLLLNCMPNFLLVIHSHVQFLEIMI